MTYLCMEFEDIFQRWWHFIEMTDMCDVLIGCGRLASCVTQTMKETTFRRLRTRRHVTTCTRRRQLDQTSPASLVLPETSTSDRFPAA